ncbi:MAG TPA: hypothetical protein VHN11_15885 [Xanthobacteraceae bacterium]|jgi:hypothetical protein|nr:hypothetical protein [Xanthobacteraceae bacterium]
MSGARLYEIKPAASNWLLPTVQNQARAVAFQLYRRELAALKSIDAYFVDRDHSRDETVRLYRGLVLVCSAATTVTGQPSRRIVDRSPRAAGRANDDLDNRNRLLWHALPVRALRRPWSPTWNYPCSFCFARHSRISVRRSSFTISKTMRGSS